CSWLFNRRLIEAPGGDPGGERFHISTGRGSVGEPARVWRDAPDGRGDLGLVGRPIARTRRKFCGVQSSWASISSTPPMLTVRKPTSCSLPKRCILIRKDSLLRPKAVAPGPVQDNGCRTGGRNI